jgi:Icc-related predicted phosphoesterase
LRIVIVSDTHGLHERLGDLCGDVLIHCGDFGIGDSEAPETLRSLDAWFARQDFRHILCTGGNHDFHVEELLERHDAPFRNARYLKGEAVVLDGVTFYGAPWVPELTSSAHYMPDTELAHAWTKIPESTDVLITHTPPRGILDRNSMEKECGCATLRDRLTVVRPRLHCFGHIHASAGTIEVAGTTYVNASMVNSKYEIVRTPYIFDLEPKHAGA